MTRSLPLYVSEVEAFGDRAPKGAPGETFLLLHGYGGSSFTWRFWAQALAARGRVILVDMKGFGEAPKPDDGRYGPEELAALVVEYLEQHDLRRLTLIGHSLGGGVSLLATLALMDRGSGRIERLVLVASASYRQRLPPFVALARWPRLSAVLLRIVGARRVIRQVLRAIVHDRRSVTEDQVRAYARSLESADGVRAALDAGRQIVPASIDELAARFREIDIPTLVLWGRQDRVVPLSNGRRLAAELPQATLTILDECGHLPPEELPEESLAALENFLDDHPLAE
ncbi:MAG: alpha/beta fold hydrolase [Gemmatimonadetes bacterium]|nr:alpha/beta fold hydrolase [Gemmatimonadota bacterium]